MTMSYMEMIYIDDDDNARQTNVRAAFPTNAETWAQFRACRAFEVSKDRARFLLDYHNSKGNLADTILLDAPSFEAITNERAKSDAEYREIDKEFWDEARKEYDAKRAPP